MLKNVIESPTNSVNFRAKKEYFLNKSANQIRNYLAQGMTTKKISELTGLSATQIEYVIATNGLRALRIMNRRERDEYIIQMYKEGASTTDIARKMRLVPQSIRNVIQRYTEERHRKKVNLLDTDLINELIKKLGTPKETVILNIKL